MADEATQTAVTNFAEYEAAGGKLPAPAPEKTVEVAEPVEAVEKPEAESAAEPETAEEAQPKPGTAQPPKKKLSLSDEHAKLLREVTELRRERRELQAPAAAVAETKAEPAKPATTKPDRGPRPRISTWAGDLPSYEEAAEKWDQQERADIKAEAVQEYEKREAERQAKAAQERINETYGQKVTEHVKAHPEYTEEIGQTPMSELMANMVLHHGPALGQRLIDNKEEAKRITQLPRDIQIFEMGKLYAQSAQNGNGTQLEPEAEAPQPVKVPAKLSATGGSTSVMARPDHGAKNFAQFEELERRLAKRK